MKIAPLPAFLVLDGLTNDICTAKLLERMLHLDNTTGPMLSHLQYFLLGVLMGHNQGDDDPRSSCQATAQTKTNGHRSSVKVRL
jgi:hypothetical protein